MEEKTLMTPEEFTDLTKQVAEAGGDQGAVTALLTRIQDGFASIYAAHTEVSKANETLTADNNKLKEYNMELFFSRGKAVIDDTPKQELPKAGKQRAETITTADLFRKDDK